MAGAACPICKRPVELAPDANPYVPFCSKRCKTIDLGRWLGEGYRIPVEGEGPGSDGGGNDNSGGTPPVPPRGEG